MITPSGLRVLQGIRVYDVIASFVSHYFLVGRSPRAPRWKIDSYCVSLDTTRTQHHPRLVGIVILNAYSCYILFTASVQAFLAKELVSLFNLGFPLCCLS